MANDLQTNIDIIDDFTQRLQVAVIGAEETTAKHEHWVEGTASEVIQTANGPIKTLRGLIADWDTLFQNSFNLAVQGYDAQFIQKLSDFDQEFVNYLLTIGFEPAIIYQPGITITRRPQTVAYQGVTYYWAGTLPYTTNGNFTSEPDWLIAPIVGGIEIPQMSFASGGTIVRKTQSVLGPDGEWYFWTGSFPKVITAGSTLETAGGVGLNKFKVASGTVPLRPLMKIVATAAGVVLNAGSFEYGATMTSSSQVLAEFGTGKIWKWDGPIPKIVDADSTPLTSGGTGQNLWNEITTATGTSGAGITISENPPTGVGSGHRWYCTADGRTYIKYADGDSVQWVEESPQGSVFDQTEIKVREALRRSYAEVGLTLVPGSFESGAVLKSDREVIIQESTGKAFTWRGSYPIGGLVVPPSSNPSSSFLDITLYSGAELSVKSFGLICDGVTDDTAAWNRMLPYLNAGLYKARIPSNSVVLLQAGTSLPLSGVIGSGHMTSKIRVKTPVVATVDTPGIIYGTVGAYANSYGRIEGVRIEVDDDTTSPVIVLKLNTVSRGAGMRDVTIHCGVGSCVGVEDFYYYQFDNVVFEGRYINDPDIGPSNKLKGKAFRQLANKEINNIQFNKCDFRYLEEPFEAAGTFVGSNSIGFYNCAIEKMGRGLGNMKGWLVTFTEGYWEKLGLNQSYASGEATLFSCGAGAVTANKVLANLGTLPSDRPFIDATLCTVRFQDVFGVRPTAFTSTVLKQNTFSSRGVVLCDNSPVFDEAKQPAFTRIPQQYVGGYSGAKNDSFSGTIATTDFSRNFLKFFALSVTGAFSLNERTVCNLLLPTGSKYMLMIDGAVYHNRSDTSAQEQMSLRGSALLDTSIDAVQNLTFTNVKTGAEFDATWDLPFFVRYAASESGGYRRYELVFGTKTGRPYSRSVVLPLDLNIVFVSGSDKTIGLVPA